MKSAFRLPFGFSTQASSAGRAGVFTGLQAQADLGRDYATPMQTQRLRATPVFCPLATIPQSGKGVFGLVGGMTGRNRRDPRCRGNPEMPSMALGLRIRRVLNTAARLHWNREHLVIRCPPAPLPKIGVSRNLSATSV